MSTASGKTATMCTFVAGLAERYPNSKFAILVHSEELIEQIAETYARISGTKPAVFSASLKRREIGKVTIGQIQSVYGKATNFGALKLVVIDECDCVPVTGDGMYRTFLKEARVVNPELRVCGFTATPFRMGTGLVHGDKQPFSELVYDTNILELMKDGWLCPLRSKDGGAPDLTGVHVRQGEFVASELETVMSAEDLVSRACEEIAQYGKDRRSWLIFACGVKHAEIVATKLSSMGITSATITGETDKDVRRDTIKKFREGGLRVLLNIQCLTVGFDAPATDLVVMLRPTKSPRLYVQMVGRGLRVSPSKKDTMILDLSGNISRHGPIDTLNERIKNKKKSDKEGVAPTKTCPKCQEIVAAGVRLCPCCEFEFPPPEIAKHDTVAAYDTPLSNSEIREIPVDAMTIRVHSSKDPSKAPTLCVNYMCASTKISEWLSVDEKAHTWARHKAKQWFRDTPLENADGKQIVVRDDGLYGITAESEIRLTTAMACVQFLACIPKPTRIRFQTTPESSKFPKVLGRSFA
jgi:DNA repair protein RadD